MGRYDNVKIKEKNGNKSYKTTYYDKTPEKNDDIYVQSQFMNIEPGKVIRIPSSTQSAHGE